MNKTCIIIAGPTAVSKTALAIELAQHFSTKIISADSRQCFKELNIGVAKPSDAELSLVHHYFINSHSVTDSFSAADYESYALQSVHKIFGQNDIAVMVGGTGLYIKAFEEGLDEIRYNDKRPEGRRDRKKLEKCRRLDVGEFHRSQKERNNV